MEGEHVLRETIEGITQVHVKSVDNDIVTVTLQGIRGHKRVDLRNVEVKYVGFLGNWLTEVEPKKMWQFESGIVHFDAGSKNPTKIHLVEYSPDTRRANMQLFDDAYLREYPVDREELRDVSGTARALPRPIRDRIGGRR